MAGVVLVADSFDDGEHGGSFFGRHAGDVVEGSPQLPFAGTPLFFSEHEPVEADAEDDGEVGEDVEGRCAGAGFVATFLADVDANVVGEGLLGQASLFAGFDDTAGEVGHGVRNATGRWERSTPMTKDSRSNREESLSSVDAMDDGWEVSDELLLERVVAHYRQAFESSPRAAAWLADRGVDTDTAARFEVGWSGRTLGLSLPSPDRAAGRQLRGRLQALGVLRSTGHEQFRGCVVVPVRDLHGRVVQLCGLRLDRPQRRTDRPSAPLEEVLWLPEPGSTIFNPGALSRGEVIVAGSVLDALVWWAAGFHHVIASAGRKHSPRDLAARLHAAHTGRALLAMPRTTTGDQDARALAGEVSLFYLGETELAHKVLSVAEADGASRAAYPLRLLQSEGELSIASTGKDPAGGLVTRTYRSRGPVALFLTTTAPALDDELANRCVVLGVDEDPAQTRAILAAQRQAQTLDGLLARRDREAIRALHANAQRLLEPVAVVNPLAPGLAFADGRTRARRDQAKYLTLIRAVALLHQHQRPRHRAVCQGVEVVYIEATAADVAVADRLGPILLGGDRVGELAPQSRRLLGLLDAMTTEHAGEASGEAWFTRRQAREHTGWSDFALRRHLARLVDLELVAVQRRGHAFTYRLLWHDDTGYDARSDGDAMASRGGNDQHGSDVH